MEIFLTCLGLIVIAIGVFWRLLHTGKPEPDHHRPAYAFRIDFHPEQADSADVCLYADGCYHSLSYVWKKKDGSWKYGGSRPWSGYAATREMAIEISKKWLIRDADLGLIENFERGSHE